MVSFPRLTVLTALLLGCAAIVASGCSRQGEGERCVRNANNDADCDDGLVCIPQEQLLGGADKADRCCYAEVGRVSDSRCTRGTPQISSAGGAGGGLGAAGSAGSTAAAGTAGAATAGTGGVAGEGGATGISGAAGEAGAAGTAGESGSGGAAGASGAAGSGGAG